MIRYFAVAAVWSGNTSVGCAPSHDEGAKVEGCDDVFVELGGLVEGS